MAGPPTAPAGCGRSGPLPGVGMTTPKKPKQSNHGPLDGERAVLVTTAHRGVFFGYATKTDGETIQLRRARNCLYWSRSVQGFLGLAASGPNSDCRIGPAADIELRDITCVAECTPAATQAWETGPWNR